jgi:DNA-binding beta-propeller fold protein YncE
VRWRRWCFSGAVPSRDALGPCTSALLATIHVNPLPLQIRVTPDGTQAIVTHYQNAISFIDFSSNTVSAVINTDSSFTPSGIAVSPDGSYALVTNYEAPPEAYLAVVDLSTRKITSTIPLDTAYPQSVFINPDATLAWVTFPWNESVEVIDLMTGARVASFFLDTPYIVAFNPTGTMAYPGGGEGIGSVEVIDTSSYTLVKTIPTGAGAGDLRVGPGEAFVSVNNAFGGSVTVFNPQTFSSWVPMQ